MPNGDHGFKAEDARNWERWRGQIEGRLMAIEKTAERQVEILGRMAEWQEAHDKTEMKWHETVAAHIAGSTATTKAKDDRIRLLETESNKDRLEIDKLKSKMSYFMGAIAVLVPILIILANLITFYVVEAPVDPVPVNKPVVTQPAEFDGE